MVLVLGACGVFVACAVGGLVGFASSLLLLPVLLLLDVPLSEAVAINLTLAVLTRLPSVVALRRHLDRRRTATMLLGSVPGTALGLAVVRAVPATGLEVVAGVLVLSSGIYLVRAPRWSTTSTSPRDGVAAFAGACSGLLGITTSLNGVPPAVLLARSGAAVQTRLADLTYYFVVGNCLTLVLLSISGGLSTTQGSATLVVWLVAGLVGNVAGLWWAGGLDLAVFERLTTWLVLLSGVVALAGAVLG